ncbi:hypothetical protein [uncultured Nocardioides sp.]|uniref:hypothetical protein n=1 Tax=uncultured Nocardioides sp. TaxID=198441 RepID=UPI0030F8B685
MSETTSESELTAFARLGANQSWINTKDRTARTANARAALAQKFLDLAGGDPERAESLRRAHYCRMALKSAQVRRARGSVA